MLDERIIPADDKYYIYPEDIDNNITQQDAMKRGLTFPFSKSKGQITFYVTLTQKNAQGLLELSDEKRGNTPDNVTIH